MERPVETLLRGSQFKQLLENYVRSLRKKYSLKRTEVEVLYYLQHCDDHNTAKDITASLHMNKGHISQTTDSLCQKGYISATRDTGDYRVVHYSLTEDARKVTDEIDSALSKLYSSMFEGISDEDMKTFRRIASQIASNVTRLMG